MDGSHRGYDGRYQSTRDDSRTNWLERDHHGRAITERRDPGRRSFLLDSENSIEMLDNRQNYPPRLSQSNGPQDNLFCTDWNQNSTLEWPGNQGLLSEEDIARFGEEMLRTLTLLKFKLHEALEVSPEVDDYLSSYADIRLEDLCGVADRRISRLTGNLEKIDSESQSDQHALNIIGEALIQDLIANSFKLLIEDKKRQYDAVYGEQNELHLEILRIQYQMSQIFKDRDKIILVMLKRSEITRLDYNKALKLLSEVVSGYESSKQIKTPERCKINAADDPGQIERRESDRVKRIKSVRNRLIAARKKTPDKFLHEDDSLSQSIRSVLEEERVLEVEASENDTAYVSHHGACDNYDAPSVSLSNEKDSADGNLHVRDLEIQNQSRDEREPFYHTLRPSIIQNKNHRPLKKTKRNQNTKIWTSTEERSRTLDLEIAKDDEARNDTLLKNKREELQDYDSKSRIELLERSLSFANCKIIELEALTESRLSLDDEDLLKNQYLRSTCEERDIINKLLTEKLNACKAEILKNSDDMQLSLERTAYFEKRCAELEFEKEKAIEYATDIATTQLEKQAAEICDQYRALAQSPSSCQSFSSKCKSFMIDLEESQSLSKEAKSLLCSRLSEIKKKLESIEENENRRDEAISQIFASFFQKLDSQSPKQLLEELERAGRLLSVNETLSLTGIPLDSVECRQEKVTDSNIESREMQLSDRTPQLEINSLATNGKRQVLDFDIARRLEAEKKIIKEVVRNEYQSEIDSLRQDLINYKKDSEAMRLSVQKGEVTCMNAAEDLKLELENSKNEVVRLTKEVETLKAAEAKVENFYVETYLQKLKTHKLETEKSVEAKDSEIKRIREELQKTQHIRDLNDKEKEDLRLTILGLQTNILETKERAENRVKSLERDHRAALAATSAKLEAELQNKIKDEREHAISEAQEVYGNKNKLLRKRVSDLEGEIIKLQSSLQDTVDRECVANDAQLESECQGRLDSLHHDNDKLVNNLNLLRMSFEDVYGKLAWSQNDLLAKEFELRNTADALKLEKQQAAVSLKKEIHNSLLLQSKLANALEFADSLKDSVAKHQRMNDERDAEIASLVALSESQTQFRIDEIRQAEEQMQGKYENKLKNLQEKVEELSRTLDCAQRKAQSSKENEEMLRRYCSSYQNEVITVKQHAEAFRVSMENEILALVEAVESTSNDPKSPCEFSSDERSNELAANPLTLRLKKAIKELLIKLEILSASEISFREKTLINEELLRKADERRIALEKELNVANRSLSETSLRLKTLESELRDTSSNQATYEIRLEEVRKQSQESCLKLDDELNTARLKLKNASAQLDALQKDLADQAENFTFEKEMYMQKFKERADTTETRLNKRINELEFELSSSRNLFKEVKNDLAKERGTVDLLGLQLQETTNSKEIYQQKCFEAEQAEQQSAASCLSLRDELDLMKKNFHDILGKFQKSEQELKEQTATIDTLHAVQLEAETTIHQLNTIVASLEHQLQTSQDLAASLQRDIDFQKRSAEESEVNYVAKLERVKLETRELLLKELELQYSVKVKDLESNHLEEINSLKNTIQEKQFAIDYNEKSRREAQDGLKFERKKTLSLQEEVEKLRIDASNEISRALTKLSNVESESATNSVRLRMQFEAEKAAALDNYRVVMRKETSRMIGSWQEICKAEKKEETSKLKKEIERLQLELKRQSESNDDELSKPFRRETGNIMPEISNSNVKSEDGTLSENICVADSVKRSTPDSKLIESLETEKAALDHGLVFMQDRLFVDRLDRNHTHGNQIFSTVQENRLPRTSGVQRTLVDKPGSISSQGKESDCNPSPKPGTTLLYEPKLTDLVEEEKYGALGASSLNLVDKFSKNLKNSDHETINKDTGINFHRREAPDRLSGDVSPVKVIDTATRLEIFPLEQPIVDPLSFLVDERKYENELITKPSSVKSITADQMVFGTSATFLSESFGDIDLDQSYEPSSKKFNVADDEDFAKDCDKRPNDECAVTMSDLLDQV